MFHSISWRDYWTTVTVLVLMYYLFVYACYFRGSVKLPGGNNASRSLRSGNSGTSGQPVTPPLDDTNNVARAFAGNEENTVHACMDELNAFFENQKKSKVVKTELVYSLYSLLQKYPLLRSSQYREAFTHVIATQCENICAIHLSAEELKGVWFG